MEIVKNEDLMLRSNENTEPLLSDFTKTQTEQQKLLKQYENRISRLLSENQEIKVESEQKLEKLNQNHKEEIYKLEATLFSAKKSLLNINTDFDFHFDYEMEKMHKLISKLKQQKDNLDIRFRYEKLLELVGEKTERIFELENDILDMKQAYREQIEQLIPNK